MNHKWFYITHVKKHELKCTMLKLCPLKHRSMFIYLMSVGRKYWDQALMLCFFRNERIWFSPFYSSLLYYILTVVLPFHQSFPTTSPLLQIHLSPDPPPTPHTSPPPSLHQDIQGYQPNTASQTTIWPDIHHHKYTLNNAIILMKQFSAREKGFLP